VPAPAFWAGVLVPYPVLVPYSKYHVDGRPFGLTVPLSVAPVAVISVAAPVAATGLGAAAVVSRPSAPRAAPLALVATRR
jgi:hypothetical protein